MPLPVKGTHQQRMIFYYTREGQNRQTRRGTGRQVDRQADRTRGERSSPRAERKREKEYGLPWQGELLATEPPSYWPSNQLIAAFTTRVHHMCVPECMCASLWNHACENIYFCHLYASMFFLENNWVIEGHHLWQHCDHLWPPVVTLSCCSGQLAEESTAGAS